MRLRLVAQGAKFDVSVLDRSSEPGRSNEPAWTFFSQLGSKEQKAMQHRIVKHAEGGPLRNVEHSRHLDDGIFEFKTRFGDRLLWFYDGPRQTVLTNGFKKGDSARAAIDVAKQMRGEWHEWKSRPEQS